MSLNNANNPMLVLIPLGSIASAGELPGLSLPFKAEIKSVKIINNADISASDTDYAQVSLQKGSTVIAEIDTRAAHENGLTAKVGKALNLVAAQAIQDSGSDLKVVYAEGGTMALTSAVLQVELHKL